VSDDDDVSGFPWCFDNEQYWGNDNEIGTQQIMRGNKDEGCNKDEGSVEEREALKHSCVAHSFRDNKTNAAIYPPLPFLRSSYKHYLKCVSRQHIVLHKMKGKRKALNRWS
jgi:hypothetical protein